MKKKSVLFLTPALLLTMLVGCNGETSSSATQNSSSSSSTDSVITVPTTSSEEIVFSDAKRLEGEFKLDIAALNSEMLTVMGPYLFGGLNVDIPLTIDYQVAENATTENFLEAIKFHASIKIEDTATTFLGCLDSMFGSAGGIMGMLESTFGYAQYYYTDSNTNLNYSLIDSIDLYYFGDGYLYTTINLLNYDESTYSLVTEKDAQGNVVYETDKYGNFVYVRDGNGDFVKENGEYKKKAKLEVNHTLTSSTNLYEVIASLTSDMPTGDSIIDIIKGKEINVGAIMAILSGLSFTLTDESIALDLTSSSFSFLSDLITNNELLESIAPDFAIESAYFFGSGDNIYLNVATPGGSPYLLNLDLELSRDSKEVVPPSYDLLENVTRTKALAAIAQDIESFYYDLHFTTAYKEVIASKLEALNALDEEDFLAVKSIISRFEMVKENDKYVNFKVYDSVRNNYDSLKTFAEPYLTAASISDLQWINLESYYNKVYTPYDLQSNHNAIEDFIEEDSTFMNALTNLRNAYYLPLVQNTETNINKALNADNETIFEKATSVSQIYLYSIHGKIVNSEGEVVSYISDDTDSYEVLPLNDFPQDYYENSSLTNVETVSKVIDLISDLAYDYEVETTCLANNPVAEMESYAALIDATTGKGVLSKATDIYNMIEEISRAFIAIDEDSEVTFNALIQEFQESTGNFNADVIMAAKRALNDIASPVIIDSLNTVVELEAVRAQVEALVNPLLTEWNLNAPFYSEILIEYDGIIAAIDNKIATFGD